MKKLLFNILFAGLFIFGLNGCYTIIWSPDSEFPNQDNSDNSTVYYGDNYYGDYYYYYGAPWWYDYSPPLVTSPATKTREDNPDIGNLRDNSGRSDGGRILNVQPPSRNINNSGDNGTGKSTTGSGDSSGTTVRNSSSSGSGNSSRDNSSNSNPVRNNNGGRSSGGRK